MNYQWYPGHMTKALRMMRENMALIDLVIEIVDARIPVSSRNPDLDGLAGGKPRLVILNKADLADPEVSAEWVTASPCSVVLMDSRKNGEMSKVFVCISALMEEKKQRDRKRGIKNRPVRAMVAGIPAKTGNKPGVTKGKQWISVGKDLQLLDTPGILWPKFDDRTVGRNLAFIGSINDDIIEKNELAREFITVMEGLYPQALSQRYGIAAVSELPEDRELLAEIAVKRGLLKSGSLPDIDRAASMVLDEFRNGRLGRISLERWSQTGKDLP